MKWLDDITDSVDMSQANKQTDAVNIVYTGKWYGEHKAWKKEWKVYEWNGKCESE